MKLSVASKNKDIAEESMLKEYIESLGRDVSIAKIYRNDITFNIGNN